LIITALHDEPSVAVKAVRLACDFLSKPFELRVVQEAVERALRQREGWVLRKRYEKALEEELRAAQAELDETYEGVIIGFAEMVEGKDGSLDVDEEEQAEQGTKGHCHRVREYSIMLAEALGITDPDELHDIRLGAMLHDIGKFRVPDRILWKPGKLTSEEWDVIRKHPEYGVGFVRGIPFLAGAIDIIQNHHERWDGNGYPRGLREEEIPLSARIFAVVDAYDAMTSNRCYRDSQDTDTALDEIRRHAGTQFDPRVVEAFAKIYPALRADHANLHTAAVGKNGKTAPAEGGCVTQDLAQRIRAEVTRATRVAFGG
jgi:putative nucleotidyltransferase with HDIG domain